MNFISHMPSPRSSSNHFIVGSTSLLSILPECLNNFAGVSRRLSKTEEEFLLNLVHSLEVSWFQLHIIRSNCFICQISFSYPSGVCQKLFSCFFSPKAIIPVIVLYLSRCFVQVFFISSLSLCSFASKSPLAYWLF